MKDNPKPRIWWVCPGEGWEPPQVIDAPPELFINKVTGEKINPGFYKKFVKVVEVLPGGLDIELD